MNFQEKQREGTNEPDANDGELITLLGRFRQPGQVAPTEVVPQSRPPIVPLPSTTPLPTVPPLAMEVDPPPAVIVFYTKLSLHVLTNCINLW
jgi:hypothetical protein